MFVLRGQNPNNGRKNFPVSHYLFRPGKPLFLRKAWLRKRVKRTRLQPGHPPPASLRNFPPPLPPRNWNILYLPNAYAASEIDDPPGTGIIRIFFHFPLRRKPFSNAGSGDSTGEARGRESNFSSFSEFHIEFENFQNDFGGQGRRGSGICSFLPIREKIAPGESGPGLPPGANLSRKTQAETVREP